MGRYWFRYGAALAAVTLLATAWYAAAPGSPEEAGQVDSGGTMAPGLAGGESDTLLAEPLAAHSDLAAESRAPSAPSVPGMAEYQTLSEYGAVPPALEGTSLPRFSLNANGDLVVDASVRRVFDYFLMGARREGTDVALARIREYIDMTLPQSSRDRARGLLDDYRDYQRSLADFTPEVGEDADALADLEVALSGRSALRRQHLGREVANAFFAEEEAYDRYTLARMQVMHSRDEATEATLARAERELPAPVRRQVRRERDQQTLSEGVNALREAGATETEIHELRSRVHGREAADRLAQLEDDSPQWRERVQAFERQKTAIENARGLSEAERRQQVRALRRQSFSRLERLKLARSG